MNIEFAIFLQFAHRRLAALAIDDHKVCLNRMFAEHDMGGCIGLVNSIVLLLRTVRINAEFVVEQDSQVLPCQVVHVNSGGTAFSIDSVLLARVIVELSQSFEQSVDEIMLCDSFGFQTLFSHLSDVSVQELMNAVRKEDVYD